MKITFTYTNNDDEAILTRAKELGYKEQIMDESQLVDGKVPMVHATDDEGNLLYEKDYEYDDQVEIIGEEFRLDEEGNKIPLMKQKDILIANPVSAAEYVAAKAKTLVAEFLAEGANNTLVAEAEKEAKTLVAEAKKEANTLVKNAKEVGKQTTQAVEASIEVTIE